MIRQAVIIAAFAYPDQIEIGKQVHVKIQAVCVPGPFIEMVPAVEIHSSSWTITVDDFSRPPQSKPIKCRIVYVYTVNVQILNHPVQSGNIKIVETTVRRSNNREV